MPANFFAKMFSIFEGDPGVRLVADDPALSAELLLLFRMILADGEVSENEMDAFRRICRDAFAIPEDSIDAVIDYLLDVGYETTGRQAIEVFQGFDIDRRRALARHMATIAKADHGLKDREVRLLKRTLDMLGLTPEDAVGQPTS